MPKGKRKPTKRPRGPAGSLPLANSKHEKFAQAIAAGVPLPDAYKAAGFSGSNGNARRLRCQEAVQARIEALKIRIAEKATDAAAKDIAKLNYTREDAFAEAGIAMVMAISMGQSAAAVSAVKLRSEIAGLVLGEPLPKSNEEDMAARAGLDNPEVAQDLDNIRAARKLVLLTGGKEKKTA